MALFNYHHNPIPIHNPPLVRLAPLFRIFYRAEEWLTNAAHTRCHPMGFLPYLYIPSRNFYDKFTIAN